MKYLYTEDGERVVSVVETAFVNYPIIGVEQDLDGSVDVVVYDEDRIADVDWESAEPYRWEGEGADGRPSLGFITESGRLVFEPEVRFEDEPREEEK